jgi:NAD(P)-dependent dehydrogenase (short-subunit alcohol dehydrogenase family)
VPKNRFTLDGKIAVITGAASGIAQSIAIGYADAGVDTVIADINSAGLAETAAEIVRLGRRAVSVQCDTSDPSQVDSLFQTLDSEFGRVDILVNAPYTFARVKPEDLTLDEWNKAIAVCLTGFFMCSQQAGRRMIAQGTGGSILNIGSIGGQNSLGRGNFVYGVAKSGVHQMTRELATEWAKHNIRVNAILPSQTRTAGVRRWLEDPKTDPKTVDRLLVGIPLNRLGETEDVVGPAIFLVSDAASYVTGVLLPVDGGNLALNAGGSHTW